VNLDQQGIREVLESYKKITVIGLSADEDKPSHSVPFYMKSHGYEIIGVHPRAQNIDDVRIYATLAEVPKEDRKFIDVFRRSGKIPEVVDEVLRLGGTEVLWLQLGITNFEAEARDEAAGLKVISDRCLYIEHQRI